MTDLLYPDLISPLSQEAGGGYGVEFPDLPGCLGTGDTVEGAMADAAEAMEEWLDVCKQLGRPIPPVP